MLRPPRMDAPQRKRSVYDERRGYVAGPEDPTTSGQAVLEAVPLLILANSGPSNATQETMEEHDA
jgi:hypothetical protein